MILFLHDIIFGPKDPNFITYRFFCEVSQFFGFTDSDICNVEMPFIIQNTDMSGQVSLLIWICITVGFVVGFPFILWEVWKFISPALYSKEKKYAEAFIIISSFLILYWSTFWLFYYYPSFCLLFWIISLPVLKL